MENSVIYGSHFLYTRATKRAQNALCLCAHLQLSLEGNIQPLCAARLSHGEFLTSVFMHHFKSRSRAGKPGIRKSVVLAGVAASPRECCKKEKTQPFVGKNSSLRDEFNKDRLAQEALTAS